MKEISYIGKIITTAAIAFIIALFVVYNFIDSEIMNEAKVDIYKHMFFMLGFGGALWIVPKIIHKFRNT